jgi:hypothetical protein
MNMEPVVECVECGRLVDAGYATVSPTGAHICRWCEVDWDLLDEDYSDEVEYDD